MSEHLTLQFLVKDMPEILTRQATEDDRLPVDDDGVSLYDRASMEIVDDTIMLTLTKKQ